jgi:hypothetical protein
LVLPQEDVPNVVPLPRYDEPHVDYVVNHIFILEEFVASLEAKAIHKEISIEDSG